MKSASPRNGYCNRIWETRAGTVELRIPKLCKGRSLWERRFLVLSIRTINGRLWPRQTFPAAHLLPTCANFRHPSGIVLCGANVHNDRIRTPISSAGNCVSHREPGSFLVVVCLNREADVQERFAHRNRMAAAGKRFERGEQPSPKVTDDV